MMQNKIVDNIRFIIVDVTIINILWIIYHLLISIQNISTIY